MNDTPTPTPLQDLWDQCERHDWESVWDKDPSGLREETRLCVLARSIPGGEELFMAFHDHVFSGDAWRTPKQPKPERPT